MHGGSDSLHVTEKNGKALVRCFACNAKYRDIVQALEDAPEQEEPEPEAASLPTIRRVRRQRRTAAEVSADGEQAEPAAAPVSDPLEWYGQYCGIDPALIASLGVEATADGWVRHTWDGLAVGKDRRPNSRDRRWVPKGAHAPRLWPLVGTFPLEPEVWLAEGETDVIVLRLGYGLAAFTAGSASQPLSEDEFRLLKRYGVERVVVAYDSDKDGLRARKDTVEAARAAGIAVSVASPSDPISGGFKDWRERWLANPNPKDVPATSADDWEDLLYQLSEIEAAEDEALLRDPLGEGRIHPADHTVLFGDGGTGKGVFAAWWVAGLSHDMKVLVVDYEAHAQHEWRPRVEHFGGNLENVLLIQPDRAIWDVADLIHGIVKAKGVDLVVVDSVTYACVGSEVEKSSTAAQYSVAIAQFGCAVLSLAHVTKADLDPTHPFGSTFWSNGARLTWSLHYDHDDPLSPRKLQAQKSNQAAFPDPVWYDWTWVTSGLPGGLTPVSAPASTKTPKGQDLEELLRVVAIDLGGGTATELMKAANEALESTGREPLKRVQQVTNLLGRRKDGGWVHDEDTGRWSFDSTTVKPGGITIRRKRRAKESDEPQS